MNAYWRPQPKRVASVFVLGCVWSCNQLFAECQPVVRGKTTFAVNPAGFVPEFPTSLSVLSHLVQDCDEFSFDFYGLTFDAKTEHGTNKVNANLRFNFAEISTAAISGLLSGVGLLSFDPPSAQPCPLPLFSQDLASMAGSMGTYAISGSPNAEIYNLGKAEIDACDTIVVTSQTPTTIELPVSIHGSVTVGGSCTAGVTSSEAVAVLRLSGTIGGQNVGPFQVKVEGTPLVETAAIVEGQVVSLPVNIGTNTFEMTIHGEAEVRSVAQAVSPFFPCATTAGVDFPNTIRIGMLTGPGGGPLPDGLYIRSQLTGMLYGNTLPAAADFDADGVPNSQDNCPVVANPTQGDGDDDGLGDACDPCTDTDGDGFGDPGFPANNCELDGCPSDPTKSTPGLCGCGSPEDADKDYVLDCVDNCPTTHNQDQVDFDADDIGDACDPCVDPDSDGYGFGFPAVGPTTCLHDNCPNVFNSDQLDVDGDLVGDVCDACTGFGFDFDADGDIDLQDVARVQRWFSRRSTDPRTWNAAADFSLTNNPNGPWSYGWSDTLGGTFHLFTVPGWFREGDNNWPYVQFFGGYLQGHVDEDESPEPTTIRWTSPINGLVRVSGRFFDYYNISSADADVHVLHNDITLFSGTGRPLSTFDVDIWILAGDTLDFAIGLGGNASSFGDSIVVDATIEATPACSYRDAVLSDRPLAYWRLGETSGTVARDEVGGTAVGLHPGALINAPLLGQPGAIAGDSDGCMLFAGNGEHVIVTDSPDLNFVSMPFTMEAWVKRSQSFGVCHYGACFRRIIDKAQAGGSPGYGMDMSDASIRLLGSTKQLWSSYGRGIPYQSEAGAWLHIVSTSDGTGHETTYVNGNSIGTDEYALALPWLSPLRIGLADDGSVGFLGWIDEVAIYDYALTPSQITNHYKLARNVPLSGSASETLAIVDAPKGNIAVVNDGPPMFDQSWSSALRHSDLHERDPFACDPIGVIGMLGAVVESSPPMDGDLRLNGWQSNSMIRLIEEQQDYVLPTNIQVDLLLPSNLPAPLIVEAESQNPPGPLYIPAGTEVRSFLVHFDTRDSNDADDQDDLVYLSGSVTFDVPIIGVILNSRELLANSDPYLGLPGLQYPDCNSHACDKAGPCCDRGLELDGPNTGDKLTISANRRTLTYDGWVEHWLDQVRIIASKVNPLEEPYVDSTAFIDCADEVTYNNCNSAWYRFTFDHQPWCDVFDPESLACNIRNLRLEGTANVTQQGVAYLNGHRISGVMNNPGCDPDPTAGPGDECYASQDTGHDLTDANGRRILTSPTPDPFTSDDPDGTHHPEYFTVGENELILGVVGDAGYWKPTGLEFKAEVKYDLVGDCERDGDVDLKDASEFNNVMTGPK